MLSVKKVVLFKHGVGYFERQGKVSGDTLVELSFKSDEMNDVLKSFTVLDLSGGRISSIGYESTKPLAKQLEDLSIHLSDNNGFTGLLSQATGAGVRIKTGSGEISGIIAGLESRDVRNQGVTTRTQLMSILVDGRSLRRIDVDEIEDLTILDENLQKDLNRLLKILILSKKKDLKRLKIMARGEGERTLTASYVVETPLWKASYRVILEKNENPMIQGWALVDNTTGDDWEDVRLTLVAGTPVSFIHNLYSPRYKFRPVVKVREGEIYPYLDFDEGYQNGYGNSYSDDGSGGGYGVFTDFSEDSETDPPDQEDTPKNSSPVLEKVKETSDLFQYEIETPVTVKKDHSALVPILQTNIEGKPVLLYNSDVRKKGPMSSILLKNTTDLTFEDGPMTILNGETYIGEAMFNTLKPGEECVIPYSAELGCSVTAEGKTDRFTANRVTIRKGSINFDCQRISTISYIIVNKLDRELDFFLDHKPRNGWITIETDDVVKKTEMYHRFRFKVPAKVKFCYKVQEKQLKSHNSKLYRVTKSLLKTWTQTGYVDDEIRDKIDEFLEVSDKIRLPNNVIATTTREIDEIYRDQERLRQNLTSVGITPDEKKLREYYSKKLRSSETKLQKLRKILKERMDERSKIEEKIKKMINNLEGFTKDLA